MKWIVYIVGGIIVLVAAIVAVGFVLPRTHKASRTLRVNRTPDAVWPALLSATKASSVPVDVIESVSPYLLITRVTEKETNFGGTWTIAIAAAPGPSTGSGQAGSTVTITEDGWVANPSSDSSRG